MPEFEGKEPAPSISTAAASPAANARPWASIDSGAKPQDFCQTWLAQLCQLIPSVDRGLLLFNFGDGKLIPIAAWPINAVDHSALARVAERAIVDRREAVFWARGEPGGAPIQKLGMVIAYPAIAGDQPFAVVAINLVARNNVDLPSILRQLHWATGWLEAFHWRQQLERTASNSTRTSAALDILAVAGEHKELKPAALAVANEMAVRLGCDRVSIGVVRSHAVRLCAISNSASFQRFGARPDAIENAMDEAIQQAGSVAVPAIPETARRVLAAHRTLSRIDGTRAVASVVLTARGEPIGAITLERPVEHPFDNTAIALCESVAALWGPMLALHIDSNRFVTGRLRHRGAEYWKGLVRPGRPTLKLATLLGGVLVLGLCLARGEHRLTAKSVLEGSRQIAAVAPFDGFISKAAVRAGDIVKAGDTLATLDDKDLILDRLKWRSEREKLRQKQQEALAKHDRPALAVLSSQIMQAESQLALADDKLARARISAAFDGIVVSGDLSQMLGSPIEKGKVLFEVAPLNDYRVIIQVDERDVRYLHQGQSGKLLLSGMPGRPLPLTVTRVTPVATAGEGANTFRVEASLDHGDVPLRPGMEGVAKLDAGDQPLLWIWSRRLIEWASLTWWKWQP